MIGVGNFWAGGGTAAEVRDVVLADCLLVGAVVSWGGYIAVSKPLVERHGAIRRPWPERSWSAACSQSRSRSSVGPAWPAFGQVSPSAWLALGVPRAVHHAVRLGVPEPGIVAVRREPGCHFQQRLADSDDHLGHLAVR